MHFCVRRGLGLAAVLCLFGQPGSAAFTDPNLLIRGISIPSSASSRVLQVDGFFHTEDLVQISYPLHVLVWMHESTRFVRFDLTGPVASGDAAELEGVAVVDEAIRHEVVRSCGRALAARHHALPEHPGAPVAVVGEHSVVLLAQREEAMRDQLDAGPAPIRGAADVVLVRMRQHDAQNVVAFAFQKGRIGHDELDARR